jgi:hypothetical protein
VPGRTRNRTPLLLIALVACTAIGAAPPRPSGLAEDRDALGDAFVEAWLCLRHDMNSLSHGGVHPRLLDAWLAAAPRFLLRDMVRYSTEPQVVLAAAARLAEGAADEDRLLLAGLLEVHQGRPLAHAYRALSYRAGNPEVQRAVKAGIDDPRPEVRLDAARAMAAAGIPKGRERLRELLKAGDDQSDEAARALGAWGSQSDRGALVEAQKSRPDSHAVRAAIGELALRKAFPDIHLALLRFDPGGYRMVTTGGLYDTWLEALGRAIQGGARTPATLLAGVEDQRRTEWPGDDPEVVRRRISALTEFLTVVNARLDSSPRPAWPRSFADAMSRIRGETDDKGSTAFAARVAASVSICAWTAKRIEHQRLGPPTSGLRFITPGGSRVADGNLATSFRFRGDQRIVVELAEPREVEQLWLAVTCTDGKGAGPGRIRVSGHRGKASWKREVAAGRGRYFQRVDLGGKPARRLEITFLEVPGDQVACLAELRLF